MFKNITASTNNVYQDPIYVDLSENNTSRVKLYREKDEFFEIYDNNIHSYGETENSKITLGTGTINQLDILNIGYAFDWNASTSKLYVRVENSSIRNNMGSVITNINNCTQLKKPHLIGQWLN